GIATWTSDYLKSDYAKQNKIKLINTSLIGKRAVGKRDRIGIYEEIKRFLKIKKDLKSSMKNKKFNVAHLNTACSKFGLLKDYLLIKEVKKKKIPVVLQCHCDVSYMIKSKIQYYLLKKIIENT